MSAEFWEPWAPKVGQCVRLRLSAECCRRDACGGYGHPTVGHPPLADGQIGMVTDGGTPDGGDDYDDRAEAHRTGHPYEVILFDGVMVPCGGITHCYDGGWFAACELEPLDA